MLQTKIIPALTDTQADRFDQNILMNQITGCWEWVGATTSDGYGVFTIKAKQYRAHRVSYAMANGEPRPGLPLDHLCRNRACVNPAHLEAVTIRENTMRGISFAAINADKSHCSRGHALVEANLIPSGRIGRRACRSCDNALRAARHREMSGSARERFVRIDSTARYVEYMRAGAAAEVEIA